MIPFQSLLDEFQGYNPISIGDRALRVYVKCKRMGHHEIADRILKKYERKFPKHDSVIAAMFALTSIQNTKK